MYFINLSIQVLLMCTSVCWVWNKFLNHLAKPKKIN